MTETATLSRRKGSARTLTWILLAAVPALAIVTLASGVLPGSLTAQAPAVPAGVAADDTRALSTLGDDLASLTGARADDEQFAAQWQNTVRRRPSPRR
jgi:hypothetical protein